VKLGEHLENKRWAQDLTLRQFCLQNNVDCVLISKIERNRIQIGPKEIGIIKSAYKVSESEIKGLDCSVIEYTEQELVNKLPVFLPHDITEDQLKNLVEVIKNA